MSTKKEDMAFVNHGFDFVYLCLFLICLDYLRTAFKGGLRIIPGPFIATLTGLYRLWLVVTGEAPQKYRDLHDKYGPIVRVGPNHVSVSDPTMIPIIYGISSKFTKTPFYTLLSPFWEGKRLDSMFTTRDPAEHKAIKSSIAQLYAMTNIKKFEPYAEECTELFIDAMKKSEGTHIDLGVWMQWYAFDVVAYITFQRRFGFMDEQRDVDGLIEALDNTQDYILWVGQFPSLHNWLLGNPTLMRVIKKIFPNAPNPIMKIFETTAREIKKYGQEERQNSREDFLAQLRARESKDGPIPDRMMVNHLSNNILAGSDTTAISLRACFYYLMKNPRCYNKLVAEILDAERNGYLSASVSYDECLKLSYLQAVMKEAMRIHPGVGFPLERFVPEEGATICGIRLPPNTNVSVTAPVMHVNKEVYGEDAAEFRPERWIEASPEQLKLMERSFLAFGHGSRTCIGKNISIMEMGKFIPQVLRNFDIEWASPYPDWKLYTAWFWKQSGIIVKFKSRWSTLK
ncbi:cytochrome P450 [Biscogniauxia marginata]|nr:cytochrome P450 [Biscogniauxia marginata]